MKWLLVSIIVGSTVTADLLQSFEMKRHGEVSDFGASGLRRLFATLARKKLLILSVFFMAISFFAFMELLSVADLSFAVPATAGSVVIETVLARLVLKEHVNPQRWVGAALIAAGVYLIAG
jgi:drug/metabolite transporter (DMT)-like permease